MAKNASGEIDTIFEAEEGKAVANATEQLKSRSAEISLSAEIESTKAEITETTALPEKTFIFSGIPRQVYCTLSDTRLRLIQTGEGRGIAYSSRRPVEAGAAMWPRGADWTFDVDLSTASGAYIRNIYLGTWEHRCGAQLVELRAEFSWSSINSVVNVQRANLKWRFLQRVHNCG